MSIRNQGLYWSTCLLACYIIADIVFSALYVHGLVQPPDSVMLFENSAKTVHFDPILGFRYTPVTSRAARLTSGEVEFVSHFQGNNLGFQERDTVLPSRHDGIPRLAVLGDSFTAAEHLAFNWPDRLERQSGISGHLEVANFSISGAGLANWWSIVQRLWKPGGYQFDGVIFAVFEGDLHRSFSMADHRDVDYHQFGRTPGWNPIDWPDNLTQARIYMQPLRGHIVDTPRFEAALNGQWHPELPRPWGVYGWHFLHQRFRQWRAPSGTTTPLPPPPFTPGQLALIEDMRDYFQAQHMPVLVVRIPSREGLLAGITPALDTETFANTLAAHYVDGAKAFALLDANAIREHWLPHDGHWNQQGSDRFVDFMIDQLREWPALQVDF